MLEELNFTFSGATIKSAHYYEEDNNCLILADYGNDHFEIILENVQTIGQISGLISGRQMTYYTETPKGNFFEYHFSFVGITKSIVVVSSKIKYRIY